MITRSATWSTVAALVTLTACPPARAQTPHAAAADSAAAHHAGHAAHGSETGDHAAHGHSMAGHAAAAHAAAEHPAHGHAAGHPAAGHAHPMSAHDHLAHAAMTGMYGPYPITREASGTSWQPDDALHRGVHGARGDWSLMLHGFADVAFDHQGGDRGDDRVFSGNMLMGMARRQAGPGTLGLRVMMSAEPATIGKRGYPLLLQTGETADGRTPLIDRQHPHDLFMELAGAYNVARGNRSLFVYAGLPGEPALGPPAFMHRFSGLAFPDAPITHHWLDSTHIAYGVLTAGAVADRLKLEVSGFRGREPDQDRWNLESPTLDSHSFRVSFNPTPAWALQASFGRLISPEQLEPDVDTDRTTASALYAHAWDGGHGEATLAWGRNRNRPGHILDAFTAEAAAQLRDKHTVFARVERVEKDELFPPGSPLEGRGFEVGRVSAGYRAEVWRDEHVALGVGALGGVSLIPSSLEAAYGERPVSLLVFAHAELR